ncbi:hypothetical protein FB451DRAFT_1172534 [Mycena latifolia]|nr:hypothetical protein FB451DRAFT_1172534 [Mycena latifolia]
MGRRVYGDVIRFPKSAFDGNGAPLVRAILDRSRDLPLSVTFDSTGLVRADSDAPYFKAVWDLDRRLQAITMDVTSADATPSIFPCDNVFPILSSIDITIGPDMYDSLDIIIILESFQHAPALRRVELYTDESGSAIVTAPLPWSQLTHLTLALCITVDVTRDVLVQCTALEAATLSQLFESEDDAPLPPQRTRTLDNLRELDISVISSDGAVVAGVMLNAATLPCMTSLPIATTEHATPALLALHARSPFPLAHLTLRRVLLSPDDLSSLLYRLPSLQALQIHACSCICISDRLFQMLTCTGSPSLSPDALRLPPLTMLTIHPLTANLNGSIIAAMVESLAPGGARGSSPFPALGEIRLYRGDTNRRGPTFGKDVERRLNAVRATGFLVDRYPSHRNQSA